MVQNIAEAQDSLLLLHNVPVYNELEEALEAYGKAIVISAPGTGKSYVSAEYLRRHGIKGLVVCPKTPSVKKNRGEQ